MGNKRTQKDRLYLSSSEHATYQRDNNNNSNNNNNKATDSNRFNYCALTNKPINPQSSVTTSDGYYIFDLYSIIPYINKYHKHPVYNTTLNINDLIKLKWSLNANKQYIDPVTMNIFNTLSHIVCIKNTGNLYLYDTIYNNCIKNNDLHDLITGDAFTLNDIITIQNPTQSSEQQPKRQAINNNNNIVTDKQSNINKTNSTQPKQTMFANNNNSNASLTKAINSNKSQSLAPSQLREQQYNYLKHKYKNKPYKGYVSLITSLGIMNIQVHCDLVPHMAHNFMLHCKNNTYSNTLIHTVKRNYVCQCGKSIDNNDKTAFNDIDSIQNEYHTLLSHNQRGIISMANNNKQQFYITLNDNLTELDNKYSIVGHIIDDDSLSVLDKIESVDVDGDYKPNNDIIIYKTNIFQNPFDETFDVIDSVTKKVTTYNNSDNVNDNNNKQQITTQSNNAKQQLTQQQANLKAIYSYDTW